MSARVLIVEDERHLAEGLRFNLEAEGYRVEIVADGEAALERVSAEGTNYDVIILDVMLPGGIDGFQVAAEMRAARQFTPVLMLTARGRPEDVLRGFESGADDYLPKPFELSILLARLRGLLRRREWLRGDQQPQQTPKTPAPHVVEDVFEFGGKAIDFAALELRAGERVVRLTLMEAELLRYLVRHAGRPIPRKQMLEEVWNLHEDTDTRAIDNFIVRLRKYIEEDPSNPRHLLTIRGVGYRFVPEP
ncbi:MAG: response regulator transcription factor [Pyrinomonadaceae bacterium]